MGYDPTKRDSKEKCPLAMKLNMAEIIQIRKIKIEFLIYYIPYQPMVHV